MGINYFKILIKLFFKAKIIYKKHHMNKKKNLAHIPKLKLVLFLKNIYIFILV